MSMIAENKRIGNDGCSIIRIELTLATYNVGRYNG